MAPSPATTSTAAPTAAGRMRPARIAASVTPPTAVSAVSSSGPPIRTTDPSGLDTWAMAIVASGTPPKGQVHLSNSARANAAGKAARRRWSGGTSAPATACMAAKLATAKDQPTSVKSTIQTVAGPSQLTLTRADSPARRQWPASVSNSTHSAIPTKPSGQKPQGGSEAASSSPAAMPRTQGLPSLSSDALSRPPARLCFVCAATVLNPSPVPAAA